MCKLRKSLQVFLDQDSFQMRIDPSCIENVTAVLGIVREEHLFAVISEAFLSSRSGPPRLRVPIIVKLCPREKGTALLFRHISSVTHPKVLSKAPTLLLYDPQHTRHSTEAPWCESWVHIRMIVSVCDVDAYVSGYWMWIYR